jgi:hypothetical protein
MGLSGNLKTMGLSDLLQWLGHSQKTGTLLLTGVEVEKSVLFEQGYIIATSSNDPREYLGQFLVNYGYITEEELRKAVEVQQEFNMLLGKILVMIDAISEEELQKLMRLKAEETIYDVFMWDEGDFTFIEDFLPEIKMVPLQLEVTRIIMEGLQRSDEWSEIRQVIPRLECLPERMPGRTASPDMEEKERVLLDLVDGRRNVKDLAFLLRSREFSTAKGLYHLHLAGLVMVLPPSAPIVEEHRAALHEVEEGDIEIYRMLTRSSMQLKKGEWEKSWQTVQNARSFKPMDPQVLEKYEQVMSFILAELDKLGIQAQRVPVLTRPLTEITGENITPKEGFVISRINGTWDIKAIAAVSPMHAVDSFLVFYRLKQKGIITLHD